jgi:DNA processing protein
VIEALGPRQRTSTTSSGTPVSRLQTVYLVLIELDLPGRLHRHPGGMVSLAFDDP